MQIAVTGATGFIGRYIIAELAAQGHQLRCLYRRSSQIDGFAMFERQITWVLGDLAERNSAATLVQGCDAVVHGALFHPGGGFQGGEGELIEFVQRNVVGSLALIEEARAADVNRFLYISSCSVHDRILDDRPLDETHPTWAQTHYGAHKGAVEQFVHSYGYGMGYPICALRPCGVYGVGLPVEDSKWFDLIRSIVHGEDVECKRGGKEVHASDVARAVSILLTAEGIAGEAYNCCDRYVSEFEVATIARDITESPAKVRGRITSPKHQIETGKLQGLGMQFGGRPLLEETVRELVDAIRNE